LSRCTTTLVLLRPVRRSWTSTYRKQRSAGSIRESRRRHSPSWGLSASRPRSTPRSTGRRPATARQSAGLRGVDRYSLSSCPALSPPCRPHHDRFLARPRVLSPLSLQYAQPVSSPITQSPYAAPLSAYSGRGEWPDASPGITGDASLYREPPRATGRCRCRTGVSAETEEVSAALARCASAPARGHARLTIRTSRFGASPSTRPGRHDERSSCVA
jgi:hypothetical protein